MTKQLTIRSNEKLITIVTDNHETLDNFIKWLHEYRDFDEIIDNNYTISSERQLVACNLKAQKLGLLPQIGILPQIQ